MTTETKTLVRRRDPETSWEAASSQTTQKREMIQRRIYATLLNLGPMTDDELLQKLGRDEYSEERADGTTKVGTATPSSLRTRRHELVELGWVVYAGYKRETRTGGPSKVWRVATATDPYKAPEAKGEAKPTTRGLEVAAAWSRWNIGDDAWAASIIRAYLNPDLVEAELKDEGAL